MAWIESHQSLATHRKTMLLEEALGIETPQAVGHLHLLWWWAVDNAPDGSLDGMSSGVIARAAQWRGDAEVFVAAMVTAGFIDQSPPALHNWEEYAGRFIEQRRLNQEQRRLGGQRRMAQLSKTERSDLAKRAADARWNPSAGIESGIESATECQADARGMPSHLAEMPATVPNPTVPNSTLRTTEHFASFWSAYPKKKAKAAAEKVFKRLKLDDDLMATMLAALERDKKSYDWLKENGQYIPHPATWLNGRRWEDEITEDTNHGIHQGRSGKRELTAQELADTWRD